MPHVGRPKVCVDATTLNAFEREVYSLSSPWGRAQISSEMRDAIANPQSLYQRHVRVFSDGSYVSRRTSERDPQRQSSAGREATSCRASTDSRASEQDNSFVRCPFTSRWFKIRSTWKR